MLLAAGSERLYSVKVLLGKSNAGSTRRTARRDLFGRLRGGGSPVRLGRSDRRQVRSRRADQFVVVGVAKSVEGIPIGSRWGINPLFASMTVFRTGRSAHVDASDLEEAVGGTGGGNPAFPGTHLDGCESDHRREPCGCWPVPVPARRRCRPPRSDGRSCRSARRSRPLPKYPPWCLRRRTPRYSHRKASAPRSCR